MFASLPLFQDNAYPGQELPAWSCKDLGAEVNRGLSVGNNMDQELNPVGTFPNLVMETGLYPSKLSCLVPDEQSVTETAGRDEEITGDPGAWNRCTQPGSSLTAHYEVQVRSTRWPLKLTGLAPLGKRYAQKSPVSLAEGMS